MQDKPIAISGTVIKGKQLGRKLGFPTANIFFADQIPNGTYKMNIVVDKKIYSGMCTVFSEGKICEAHIFDFTGDIYNQKIEIILLAKIRENVQFTSEDGLIHQITKDMEIIKKKSWKVLTFGTFDHLHSGHISYLNQARKYGDKLITIIALDNTVKKIKGIICDDNQNQRLANVQKIGISNHKVELGDEVNVYQCLHDRNPEIIYLGYDQHSFDDGIIHYCENNNLKIPVIIRGESFEPEKFKSSLFRESQN